MLQNRKDILKAELVALGAFLIRTEERAQRAREAGFPLTGHNHQPLRYTSLVFMPRQVKVIWAVSLPPPPAVWQKVFEIAAPGIWHSAFNDISDHFFSDCNHTGLGPYLSSVALRITAYHYLCSKISPLWVKHLNTCLACTKDIKLISDSAMGNLSDYFFSSCLAIYVSSCGQILRSKGEWRCDLCLWQYCQGLYTTSH